MVSLSNDLMIRGVDVHDYDKRNQLMDLLHAHKTNVVWQSEHKVSNSNALFWVLLHHLEVLLKDFKCGVEFKELIRLQKLLSVFQIFIRISQAELWTVSIGITVILYSESDHSQFVLYYQTNHHSGINGIAFPVR